MLTGSFVNGVLGVSPSCHFAFLEYIDVYNSIAKSVVCLVLRGAAKLELFCIIDWCWYISVGVLCVGLSECGLGCLVGCIDMNA